MTRFLILITAGLLAGTAAPAQAEDPCGPPEAPCETPMGVYHAATPEGPGPHPAVLFLHGWGGQGSRTIANAGLVGQFVDRGYAVIAPTGMPRSGMPGRSEMRGSFWNSDGRTGPGRRDDAAYLAEVAEDAAQRFDLDRTQMMVAGFSGGGMMVWRVACDAPQTFAAYAPIAGLMWRPLPEACAGPVRLFHTHGWSDPVVPIEGRSVGGGVLTQGDLFQGLDLMRTANGCAKDDPDSYAEAGRFLSRTWSNCAPGTGLAFALHPGGHSIPKGWVGLALDWFEEDAPGG